MSGLFGGIGDYLKSTFGQIKEHPWQALGAALGVPGWDPAIGGTFNNRPGGALLSPTGNFTSSAWNDMYKNNPDAKGGLDMFHKINSAADVIAPMIAGGYASGAMGGEGGANGLTGFLKGPAHYGDSGLTGTVSANGSGLSSLMNGGLGDSLGSSPTGLFSGLLPGGGMSGTASGALGGGLSGQAAGLSGIGGASMGGYGDMISNIAQKLLQQQSSQKSQQASQQAPSMSFQPSAAPASLLTSGPMQSALSPGESDAYAQILAKLGVY